MAAADVAQTSKIYRRITMPQNAPVDRPTSDPISALFTAQRAKALFTVIPGISPKKATEAASTLLECARYLDYSGTLLADSDRLGAAHHLNAMVKQLLDEIERSKKTS